MKKTTFKVLLTVLTVFVFSFALASSVNAQNGVATFTLTEIEAKPGQEFSTTLVLEENSNLIDYEFQLSYDKDLVELVSVTESDDLNGTLLILPKDNEGKLHISFTRTSSNVTRRMEMVDFVFRTHENIGVGIYNCLTIDNNWHKEAHTMVDQQLQDLDLSFDFNKMSIHAFGDVNLDNRVSILDVTLLRQHLAAMRTLSAFQLYHSDANVDSNISIFDAVRIQQKIANPAGINIGDRLSVTFYKLNRNEIYTVKSVKFGNDFDALPIVPEEVNYKNGRWSRDPEIETPFQLSETNVTKNLRYYAFYDPEDTQAMKYYKARLDDEYLKPSVAGDMDLRKTLTYQNGYTADIYWTINNESILEPDIINGKGVFRQPTYDSKLTVVATIISKNQFNNIESQGTHTYVYAVSGVFKTPPKSEIAAYLQNYVGNEINYNMKFPQKLTNKELNIGQPYEVRISWLLNENGTETPISQVFRTTTSQTVDLVAVITFNGKPLADDGRVYFDDVTLTAISMEEIRNHIIGEIAVNTGLVLSSNDELWNDDTVYGANVTWISKNTSIATIAANTVTVKETAINGTSLPLEAQVTYMTDDGAKTFALSYTTGVANANVILEPGVNIDPDLHLALKEATGTHGTLTTDALKAVKFVYLDLSKYPNITDLSGITYCTNLRVLNLSGLRITRAINEIATLNKLEALIARDCGLDNLTDGGIPVLKNAINLQLLDLANNNFSSLNSVFAPNVRYGKLSEVYLNGNGLKDISALQVAPLLNVLVLSDNGLEDADITTIQNFKYLRYLSLANNEITSVTALKDLINLVELRLQNNHILSVRDLQMLRNLQALYLGNNNICNVFTGGGVETNVSYLRFLNQLKVLYLNDNDIEDVRDLTGLNKLASFNVTNNRVQSLNFLSAYSSTLEELYAENNNVASFSFVQQLTKLRKLMLSQNASTYEMSLPTLLANLTDLETLTLSGKDLRTLSFLANMPKLVRLEVAGCNLNSTEGATDNVLMLHGLKSTLKFLNISNNGFAVEQGAGGTPFSALYELSKLIVFYCDNLAVNINAQNFFSLMSELEYISLENCGITTTSWLSIMYRLTYVNLANNDIGAFDLNENIRGRSRSLLQYLYLDSNVPGVFADANRALQGNQIKALSLKGLTVEYMDYLPDMDCLEYLNIAHTGVDNLQGSNPDFNEFFSIERFEALKTVDVTQLDAKIAPLENLPELEIVYAVGVAEDSIFYRDNILTLYNLYNKGVTAYLYSDNEEYEPVALREGAEILGELPDISCAVQIAADNVLSDNNPLLAVTVNDFPITWSVSNAVNYEIVDNKLSVKSYTNIVDEVLELTAQITVYPDQTPVTRTFAIQTHILRASAKYLDIVNTGIADYLTRESEFVYDVSVKAAPTDGFLSPVKPVYSDIRYSFSAKLSDDTSTPYIFILSVGENNTFTVVNDAPLDSEVTISVDIGHAEIGNAFVSDHNVTRTVEIVSRTNTVTYHPNGGQVLSDSDGSMVTSEQYAEDSTLFVNVHWERLGYLFEGWFADEDLTIPFTATIMPAYDVEIFAKWKAHSYTVTFDPNGGDVSTTSKMVLCDTAYGELPVPTRQYYTFLGWFTQTQGGTRIEETTVAASISADQTLYAQWQRIMYTVTFDANGGTVGTATKQVPAGDTIGTLPTPTRNYYNFDNWKNGSTIVNTSYVVLGNITLVAQWSEKPVSDWVLASAVPSGAQTVQQKWTYTHTQTSSSSSLPSGYTYVSTSYSGWSNLSGWSTEAKYKIYNPYHPGDDNHLLQDVQTKWVEAVGHTEWHYYRWYNGSTGVYSYKYNSTYYFQETWFTYELPVFNNPYQGDAVRVNGSGYANRWILATFPDAGNLTDRSATRWVWDVYAHTQYQHKTRTATYTYRKNNIETTTYPSGSGVSNIVEYVRYRPI